MIEGSKGACCSKDRRRGKRGHSNRSAPKTAHIQIVYRMFIQNAYMEVLYLTAQISKFIIDLWIKWLYFTLDLTKKRAVVQYRAIFDYALSHLIPDGET